jgi:hypothetical protein
MGAVCCRKDHLFDFLFHSPAAGFRERLQWLSQKA